MEIVITEEGKNKLLKLDNTKIRCVINRYGDNWKVEMTPLAGYSEYDLENFLIELKNSGVEF